MEDAEDANRFTLALFVIHPSLAPEEISTRLGIQPTITHAVGEPRQSPRGSLTGGTYPDTRWRHRVTYSVAGQWFIKEVSKFVADLAPKSDFLETIREGGGSTTLILSFLGDGHFGDTLPQDLLSKLIALGLELGIEVYTTPQN